MLWSGHIEHRGVQMWRVKEAGEERGIGEMGEEERIGEQRRREESRGEERSQFTGIPTDS